MFSIVAFMTLDISQGSVATHLRCGVIFSDSIITSFLLILTVKWFRNSVNIWWSQGVQKTVPCFGPPWYERRSLLPAELYGLWAGFACKPCWEGVREEAHPHVRSLWHYLVPPRNFFPKSLSLDAFWRIEKKQAARWQTISVCQSVTSFVFN